MNFNVNLLAEQTNDAYSAYSFTSWKGVCKLLHDRGFNRYEAEAILRSKLTRWCRDMFGDGLGKKNTPDTLAKYLNHFKITPGCAEVNELVIVTFQNIKFARNADGVLCRVDTMPGSPESGETLVPLGTPDCCNPHSEAYWSM